ncbi:hypothetical protein [Pelagicoccus albus]|uniref:Peptidase inhibitor I9 n=1 Tax=Pelagicoccus albus TaxID=415222 RepID=A0A7X1B9E1_9BACT|nr:hypothetical protein [Pelagicoccus albus]MBC2608099.1 hypothetical protein [Pelagicoccus albus]
MKTKNILLFLPLAIATSVLCISCATGSAISTGTHHYAATNASEVKVLTQYPETYETVGLVEASAPKGYLRKPEHAARNALQELQKQAANLGAHALVLKEYSSAQVPDFSWGEDELGLIFTTERKMVTAEAIRM